jgi:hypothetical protein
MSVSDIKRHNTGYFFSRSTMKFFGDKMSSFGVRTFEGKRILYRKPSAYVRTFTGIQQAGKTFFSCWEIKPKNESEIDICPVSEELKETFYNTL